MIERLIRSLRLLAAPAALQRARHPGFVAGPQDAAMDFADALMLAADCPQLQLESTQRDRLFAVDRLLEAMDGPANAGLWTERAVEDAPEWEEVRARAREALLSLGHPVEPPAPRACPGAGA